MKHPILSSLNLSSDTPGPSLEVLVPREELRTYAERALARSARLALMFATDEREKEKAFFVHVVFMGGGGAERFEPFILKSRIPADDSAYPSLTESIMAAHWYERLIRDQFGIEPVGHPDLRRLVHHENIPAGTHPLRKDFKWNTTLAHANEPYPMHAVEGKGVYEIPVGPIHAGIIEPGHFRFNVRGERIITLEGKLFFKHKGVEKLLEGKSPEEALPFIERISGDTAVAHALAFAQAVEQVSGTVVPRRALFLRSLYNELERITMHLFDIGNMGGMGTGFTFMAAQGFRMVEEMRRLNKSLTGSRFLRGAVTIGGAKDLSSEDVVRIVHEINRIEKEAKRILDIAFGNDGLMERFETTGILKKDAAEAYGAQGVAARASGIDMDLRADHPYAAYPEMAVEPVVETAGDVLARLKVRARELAHSFQMVRELVATMPKGAVVAKVHAKGGSALGWAEGWRGGIVDFVRLDNLGKIERCVIRDPSFCNWPLFGELGPGNIVPDFPLCNKSLNLSYSGTDL